MLAISLVDRHAMEFPSKMDLEAFVFLLLESLFCVSVVTFLWTEIKAELFPMRLLS